MPVEFEVIDETRDRMTERAKKDVCLAFTGNSVRSFDTRVRLPTVARADFQTEPFASRWSSRRGVRTFPNPPATKVVENTAVRCHSNGSVKHCCDTGLHVTISCLRLAGAD